MIHYFIGTSGTGKSEALIGVIEKNIDENNPPIVIIPDQFSFEYDNKLYSTLGAEKYNKIDTRSFQRLAELIFMEYGGKSGEYADDLTKTTVMYLAVESARKKNLLSFFRKQSEKNNFLEYFQKLVEEMKKADVSSEMLYQTIPSFSETILKSKIEDICAIYTLYEDILEKNNLKDKLNDISEASETANRYEYFKGKKVYIDEFESFSEDEIKMLEVIISQCDDVYICLRADKPDSKNPVFFSACSTYRILSDLAVKYSKKINISLFKEQYRFKNPELKHLCDNIFKYTSDKYCDETDSIHIIECKDMYSEAEYVCSQICHLVKDKEYKFNDITIVARNTDEYSGIFETYFNRYHIPYFIDTKKSALHTSIMLLITSILDLISGKFNTETVLRFAKTQLLGINYEQLAEFENYCYKWNIDGDVWCSPFNAEENQKPFIEELRIKLIEPIMELKKKCSNATGYNLCTALYEYLEYMEIPKNIMGMAKHYKENNLEYLANEIKRLWGCLCDILDVIANIFEDTIISPSGFNKLFNTMLKQNNYKNPPHSLDAVSFSSAVHARYNEPKAVFVLGVNEGSFPSAKLPESILSQNERLELQNFDINLSQTNEEIICNEKNIFYRAVSAPSCKLYLSYPLSDVSGNSLFASSFISDIESIFPEIKKCCSDKFDDIFYCCTYESTYRNYVRNISKKSDVSNILESVLKDNSIYSAKLNYLNSIQTNPDFHINNTKLITKALTENFNVSATRFETYNLCPFKFFCNSILKIYERNAKGISNQETGSLIHKCLEKMLSRYDKNEFVVLKYAQIESDISDIMRDYKETELGGNFSKTRRFEANYSKIKNTIIGAILHLQQELIQSDFYPVKYEYEISRDTTKYEIISDNDIHIILNGRIDRIDIYEYDGKKYIRIIDYKKRKKNFLMENLFYGIDMQMLLYLYYIISENGEYKGSEPAGVLYMPYAKPKCVSEKKQSEKIKQANYMMDGILLENQDILDAMDKEKKYVSVEMKKGKVLNEKQFKNLEKFVQQKVVNMTDQLYDGNIPANPLILDENNNICQYCEYVCICGDSGKNCHREKDSDALKKLFECIDEISD